MFKIYFLENDVLNEKILLYIFHIFLHIEYSYIDYSWLSRELAKFKCTRKIFKFDFLKNEDFNENFLFFLFRLIFSRIITSQTIVPPVMEHSINCILVKNRHFQILIKIMISMIINNENMKISSRILALYQNSSLHF